jgi:hypothetical protein
MMTIRLTEVTMISVAMGLMLHLVEPLERTKMLDIGNETSRKVSR